MSIEQNPNSFSKFDSSRTRYLLLHKREIRKLLGRVDQRGITMIPLEIHIAETGFIKVVFGMCEGKKLHDKRECIKQREQNVQKARFARGVYD